MLGLTVRQEEGGAAGVARIWKEPRAGSGGVATIKVEEEVKLTGCRGGWARIEHRGREGWLAPAAQCPNPVTTCP